MELHVELLVFNHEFGELHEFVNAVAEDLFEVDVAEASTQICRPATRSEHMIFRLEEEVEEKHLNKVSDFSEKLHERTLSDFMPYAHGT